MKKYAIPLLTAFVLSALFACGGSEQAPGHGAANGGTPPAGQAVPRVKPVVEVPDAIKGKWKGIMVIVADKDKKSTDETFIRLGEKHKVPASDLTIEVKEFFPSFVMQGASITSASNDPSNPAAQVVVMEGGSEIFTGWLFARFPTTHAFSHPRFAITLKEGVPN